LNSKYYSLGLNKVTDQEGTKTDKKSIIEKVRTFYPNFYKKKTLNTDKQIVNEQPKNKWSNEVAMNADLTLEEAFNTWKN
jgi:hypothetical protein